MCKYDSAAVFDFEDMLSAIGDHVCLPLNIQSGMKDF